jgi:hypothetical protein
MNEGIASLKERHTMDNKAFALDVYLKRLNYADAVRPTEGCLEALHRAQIYTIPFENFDILLGRSIALEPAALCDKLMHRKRRQDRTVSRCCVEHTHAFVV